MAFISKSELPLSLHAAYDKAAKGVENDTTRTNGKNDEHNIDSEKEVLIFESEVEKLKQSKKLNKATYESVTKSISDIKEEISKIKNYAETERKQNERNKREVKSHNKAARIDQWLMKNTPFLYALTHAFSPLKNSDGQDFMCFNDNTYAINANMIQSLNALW